ncbi:MAG: hypothetical protein JZU65_11155, partial [Chlorobium sp.]|nr:hypothetical protein [Chlorobium sp.]
TTTTVTGIPTNGAPLYVRFFSRFGTTWVFNEYTYTAAGTLVAATLTSPANASTFAGASQTFTWNPAAGANLYAVWVGTTPGTHDIGVFPELGTTATTTTVTGIPTNGAPLYVRLFSLFGTTWVYNEYTYISGP